MNRSLTSTMYYGYAQGLAAIAAIYPHGRRGSLGYLELAYKF